MNIADINAAGKYETIDHLSNISDKSINYFQFKHVLASGEIRDVEVYITPITIGKKQLLSSVIHDVSHTKEIKEESKLNMAYFDSFYTNSPDPIAIVDNQFKIESINIKFKEVFQFSAKEVINRKLTEVLCPENLYESSLAFKNSIMSGKHASEAVSRRRKDGKLLDVLVLGFPLIIDNKVNGAFFIYSDISETVEQKHQINKLTFIDGLTEVFNRDFFTKNFQNEIIKCEKLDDDCRIAILYVNVNEYKDVSEALGHLYSDGILKAVAKRIKMHIPAEYIVGKAAVDEFGIMVPRFKNRLDLDEIIERVITIFDEPFIIDGMEFLITTNIGSAVYPDDGFDSVEVLRKADIALDVSLSDANVNSVQFQSVHDKNVLESYWIKTDLAHSLIKNELYLDYQPIYNAEHNKIVGTEALLRWNHNTKGLISPIRFITIAEKTGMIHVIGKWVLFNACMQNARWQRANYKPLYISVNVSVLQIEKPGFVEIVKNVLEKTQMDPKYLQLELTETIFVKDYNQIKKSINEISKLGVKFAIDDFGTGYSSLNQLMELEINNLKIDRNFIDHVDKSHNKSKIVTATITLAKSLDIGIIAEGAERIEEVEFLKENECNIVQGYYFSKPLNKVDLEELLKGL